MKAMQIFLVFFNILIVHTIVIQTPRGIIRGFSSNDTDVFLGIRYGHIAERWTLASFPQAWNDTQNATVYGPICYQFGPYNQPFLYNETEQCLFLNIWVPKRVSQSLLPVRVWIHGGGYTAGSSNDYDGANLSRLSNSIIITINYRLGIFGFFPLPNIEERNIGWSDQQLALRWIQENIEFFGGNKSNVMLFGQSAGGSSTIAHILMESSWPLYASAIAQSAGPFLYPDCQQSEETNWKFLEATFPNCKSDLNCYRQLNATLLYEKFSLNWVTLWPCVGTRSQLEEQPIPLIRKGRFNQRVPIIVGMNFNEGQTSILTFNHFQMVINASEYYQLAQSYLIPDSLIDIYDPTTTDKDYFAALTWLFNDYYIHCPSFFSLNHFANWSTPIYAYFFVHATENWIFSPFHFNATHLTEIPYVFQNNFAATQLTNSEMNLSSSIIELFTKFHSNQQPWTSYASNQTVILFNVTTDGSMQTRFGFNERLMKLCPLILKYVDPDDSNHNQGVFIRISPVLSLFVMIFFLIC